MRCGSSILSCLGERLRSRGMLGLPGCVDSVVGAARVASANNDGAIPIPGDLEMLSWRIVVMTPRVIACRWLSSACIRSLEPPKS